MGTRGGREGVDGNWDDVTSQCQDSCLVSPSDLSFVFQVKFDGWEPCVRSVIRTKHGRHPFVKKGNGAWEMLALLCTIQFFLLACTDSPADLNEYCTTS